MVEGASQEQWEHTSLLCAVVANTFRDPKKQRRPYSPDDFNPHAERSRSGDVIEVNDKESLARMRAAFTGKREV